MTMSDLRRPIDVAPDPLEYRWCSCGKRIWGHDRQAFTVEWYAHLLWAATNDPEGDHALVLF